MIINHLLGNFTFLWELNRSVLADERGTWEKRWQTVGTVLVGTARPSR
jgi:hypothetical protein